jgi:hypothetical protein
VVIVECAQDAHKKWVQLMAGDWIKMRVWIARDPKVIAMTDHLATDREFMDWLTDPVRRRCQGSCYEHITRNVTRCVTVTGLLQVWGVANEVGRIDGDDLILRHTTIDRIDEIADVPCFGAAMRLVGWAAEELDAKGNPQIRFPNFLTNNVPTEDRQKRAAADRQRRYRQRHSNVTRNVTKSRQRREEKKREENTSPLPPSGEVASDPVPVALRTPAFLEAWSRWVAFRREIGKSLRPSTVVAQMKKFAAWGSEVSVRSIDQSIANGWTGLFEPRGPAAPRDLFAGQREFLEGGPL